MTLWPLWLFLACVAWPLIVTRVLEDLFNGR